MAAILTEKIKNQYTLIGIPFSYKQLYPNKNDDTIDGLLSKIPSKIVLLVLSYVNHQLTLRASDRDIFNFISRNWGENLRRFIMARFLECARENEAQLSFFDSWLVTEFIKRELKYYRDFEYSEQDTTPEDEWKIYLAYLLSVDEIINKQESLLPENIGNPITRFFELSWPLAVQQYEFQIPINPIFEALKSSSLLSALLLDEKYGKDVKEYLKKYGFETPWNYLWGYLELIKQSLQKYNTSKLPILRIPFDSIYEGIVQSKTLDPEKYQSIKKLQIRYSGIRKCPLLHFEDDLYIVLNWEFLYSQLGLGITFDLYNKSNLIKADYKNVMNFRSYVSKIVSEKIVFHSLLKFAYSKTSYSILNLGENDDHPDAYLRQGKSIFIFEFKDVLFPDKSVEIATYDEMIKVLRERFFENSEGKPKGVKQLINHIGKLKTSSFSFDKYERKIEKEKISIYPVIVYGHSQFSLPGVNHFLGDLFVKNVNPNGFKAIKPLTMISLDYFFEFLAMFKKTRLKNIIEEYHYSLEKINTDFEKRGRFDFIVKRFGAIEHIRHKLERNGSYKTIREDYLNELLDNFNVIE